MQVFQNSRETGAKTARTRSKHFQPKQRDNSTNSIDDKINSKITAGIKSGFSALFDRIEDFIQARVDLLVNEKM